MISLPFSPEELEKNKEVSKKLGCLSLEEVLSHLDKKDSRIYNIKKTTLPIMNLCCTQGNYSQKKYELVTLDSSILAEPIVVVNTTSNLDYIFVGHIRAKRNYDLGNKFISAYKFLVLDNSTDEYLERVYNIAGRKNVSYLTSA